MKGIILAGGTGTRLFPLTKIVNKHMLPVGKYPMIHYAVQKLRQAGITDILLVTSKQSAGLYADYFGGGTEWGVDISYKIQESAGGIAQALAQAETFVPPGEKLAVLLGDNLFADSLAGAARRFAAQPEGAMVMLKPVDDPRRYGVPVLEGGRIARIVEKPADPPTNYCVTGIYFYDSAVFDIIRTQRPSERGELEITDVNNAYAAAGTLTHELLTGWWTDAGTFDSLREATEYALRGELE
ncbi:sugar phosphate nucleotidyltransferase [Paenibacillus flagellatus]|uniref:Glucose-1-phosphate thymidylyltransferase n=1 Tax=Paenibacillus flagellatus TaxID=2211139 RepID=A0A2V5K2U3_9BACL|nr:sugar phosphate nucleotidyltransferase [Paenibacillus flagellatus]PYI52104.1 spore coat protein [Paenibacillus flagellatus]